jgi:hypothetical protein
LGAAPSLLTPSSYVAVIRAATIFAAYMPANDRATPGEHVKIG